VLRHADHQHFADGVEAIEYIGADRAIL